MMRTLFSHQKSSQKHTHTHTFTSNTIRSNENATKFCDLLPFFHSFFTIREWDRGRIDINVHVRRRCEATNRNIVQTIKFKSKKKSTGKKHAGNWNWTSEREGNCSWHNRHLLRPAMSSACRGYGCSVRSNVGIKEREEEEEELK